MVVKQNIVDSSIHFLSVYSCTHLIFIHFNCKWFLYIYFQDDQAKKKQDVLEKKAESRALLEQEMKSMQTPGKQPLAKITQAQIQVRYINRGCFVQQKLILFYWRTGFSYCQCTGFCTTHRFFLPTFPWISYSFSCNP